MTIKTILHSTALYSTVLVIAFGMLSACQPQSANGPDATAGLAASSPPMGVPQYVMRAEMPAGDRLSTGRSGNALFENLCGTCHLELGMGTNLLVRQVIAMDMTPDKALLANRQDLTADYVKAVVRNGKMAMPRLSKVDVTDAELHSIAKFLAKEE